MTEAEEAFLGRDDTKSYDASGTATRSVTRYDDGRYVEIDFADCILVSRLETGPEDACDWSAKAYGNDAKAHSSAS